MRDGYFKGLNINEGVKKEGFSYNINRDELCSQTIVPGVFC